MRGRDTSSLGVPCWVDTWQPEPRAAKDFYGGLFGWDFDAAIPMSGFEGKYYRARCEGRLVAGVGQSPPQSPAGWLTHVRVSDPGKAAAQVEQAGGQRLASFDTGAPAVLVADSSGVPFSLRAAGIGDGVEVTDQPNCWAMSSLHTPDVGEAQEFYQAMFNWQMKPVPDVPFSLWLRGSRVVAVVTAAGGDVPPHWSVNFAVTDADATAARAVGLGGNLVVAPADTTGFRSAVIQDPWGGVVAVSAVTG